MKHRLFIALDLPPSHYELVLVLQDKLNKLGLPVEWEPSEKLHLTLNFLGRVDEQFDSRLEADIRGVARRCPPFTISLAFLETFYRRHDSSLIYLGVGEGLVETKALQKSLNESMARLNLPQQTRFLPHVSIGKLSRTDTITTKSFLDKVSQIDFTPLPTFTVDRFVLYESHLSRSGSYFQKVRVFPLG